MRASRLSQETYLGWQAITGAGAGVGLRTEYERCGKPDTSRGSFGTQVLLSVTFAPASVSTSCKPREAAPKIGDSRFCYFIQRTEAYQRCGENTGPQIVRG